MSNMSYCRFQNTLSDLQDCYDNMDEVNSLSEARARESLIELAMYIVNAGCDFDESNEPSIAESYLASNFEDED